MEDNNPQGPVKLRKRFLEREGGVEWLSGPNKVEQQGNLFTESSFDQIVLDPEIKELLIEMDSAMEKYVIPDNLLVYRREGGEMEKQLLKANVGDKFRDRGFVSTTMLEMNIKMGTGYRAGVMVEKGIHAIHLPTINELTGNINKYTAERELTLDRDLEWTILWKDDERKIVFFKIRPFQE